MNKLLLILMISICKSGDEMKSINEYKRNYFKILSAEKGFNRIDEGL